MLTEDLIKVKAIEFSKKLSVEEFESNSGWLYRFKRRNNIKIMNLSGETTGQKKEHFHIAATAILEKMNQYEKKHL